MPTMNKHKGRRCVLMSDSTVLKTPCMYTTKMCEWLNICTRKLDLVLTCSNNTKFCQFYSVGIMFTTLSSHAK